jgi:hypothetical protein
VIKVETLHFIYKFNSDNVGLTRLKHMRQLLLDPSELFGTLSRPGTYRYSALGRGLKTTFSGNEGY